MTERQILCRTILTEQGWKKNQLVSVNADGTIDSISDAKETKGDFKLEGPVIPGMPNVHSHAFQRLIAGLTGGVSQGVNNFWGWREAMYGFANKITAPQMEACASWLYAEMLCAGYTSCGEFHYLHHLPDGKPYTNRAETSERMLAAADAAGIALTILPVLYQSSGFGRDSVEPHQRRFANGLDEYMAMFEQIETLVGSHVLHEAGVAPHSLRAVPEPALSTLLGSVSRRVPVHIHIAEQTAEIDDCMAFHGTSPVDWLLSNVDVDDRWCLVHATHMVETELRRAAASGAIAGLCPSTEADLGDGFFNSSKWLNAGGRFGIGSDSNLIISPAEELRMLEFSERLRSQSRSVLTSDDQPVGMSLWTHAARSGAQALGQRAGVIASGYRADLVELDHNHPLLAARGTDTILETLVFAGLTGMVRSVYVGGVQRVSNGQHFAHEALARDFVNASRALISE